jgi:heme-degrading monooxygenase HmoA
MTALHIAQLNIGRARGPVDGPIMAAFMALLDPVNALADAAPGFVWRLQTDEGNATALRPYEDERTIVNMSVWESIEDLAAFVYRSGHVDVMRRRREWFEPMTPHMVLWWVPAGHVPTVEEAKERLAHLRDHGPGPCAFTFNARFPATGETRDDAVGARARARQRGGAHGTWPRASTPPRPAGS